MNGAHVFWPFNYISWNLEHQSGNEFLVGNSSSDSIYNILFNIWNWKKMRCSMVQSVATTFPWHLINKFSLGNLHNIFHLSYIQKKRYYLPIEYNRLRHINAFRAIKRSEESERSDKHSKSRERGRVRVKENEGEKERKRAIENTMEYLVAINCQSSRVECPLKRISNAYRQIVLIYRKYSRITNH